VLYGYGANISDLAHINDVLVQAQTTSGAKLEDLAAAFSYTVPVASKAGVSFEMAAAALSLMGKAGVQADRAGTGLNGAINHMLNPTKQARAVMKEWGVSFTDAQGRLLPLDEIVRELGPHVDDAGAFLKLFGQRAGPAMAALVGQGSDALKTLSDELQNSGGVAAKHADVQMQGLKGSMRFLGSSMTNVGIALGNSVNPQLTTLNSNLGDAANAAYDYINAHQKVSAILLDTFAGLIATRVATYALRFSFLHLKGAALTLGFGLVKVIDAVKFLAGSGTAALALQDSLAAMDGLQFVGIGRVVVWLRGALLAIPGVGMLADGLAAVGGALAAVSAPVWLTVAAVAAALAATGVVVYKYWSGISAFFEGMAGVIKDQLAPVLQMAQPLFDALGAVGSTIASAWGAVSDAIGRAVKSLTGWLNEDPLSPDAVQAWKDAGAKVAQAFIDGFMILPNMVKAELQGVQDGLAQLGVGISTHAVGPRGQVMPTPPGRAHGGPISRGGSYMVGEDGPERITATRSGYVHPTGTQPGGGAGASITVHQTFNVTGAGDDAGLLRRLSDTMARETSAMMRGLFADIGLGAG
jgi:hypothetical protein